MKRKALPYIDCRPAPIAWRERSASLTVTPLMHVCRAARAWREQVRVAVQLYVCNRMTPGDAMAAYLAVLAVALTALAVVLGLHLAVRSA